MRYAIVIERGEDGYGAYVPDLPGCTTTGDTVQEVLNNMCEAIVGHVGVMVDVGDPVPDPASLVDYVDVSIPILMPKSAAKKSATITPRRTSNQKSKVRRPLRDTLKRELRV